MITLKQLQAIFPKSSIESALIDSLNQTFEKFQINTPLRQAAFLAQCGHESNGFTDFTENLNYSASGLLATFPKYFNEEQSRLYARQPEKIANRVYANRMGNGNEQSGDGWRNRGRGAIQVTFHDNYAKCMAELGVTDPDKLAELPYAILSAGWFWQVNNIKAYADKGDIDGVSDAVSIGHKTQKYGDAIGFAARQVLYLKARQVLGV